MALRKNTKRYSNTTSLGNQVGDTKKLTHADTSSQQSGVGATAGDLSHLIYTDKPIQEKTQPKKEDPFSWFTNFFTPKDQNPSVQPNTVNHGTNFTKKYNAGKTIYDQNDKPNATGTDNQANSDIQTSQNNVTSKPDGVIVCDSDGICKQWQWRNGKYVHAHVSKSGDTVGLPSPDNSSSFAEPSIPRIEDAIERQQEQLEKINKHMQANLDAQKAYTDKVNTSLMAEINGLYEANGKQNELNDMIIDAQNQKWMTQLGDEIVPLQNYDAFQEPLPLKTAGFDPSSITGSKYFIWIVVGFVALIGLSLLKGKGSGAGRSVPMSVRYG